MMKNARRIYLEYSDALIAFRDHIKGVLKVVKKVISLYRENEKLKAKIEKMKKEEAVKA
jgi:hypothetical protein